MFKTKINLKLFIVFVIFTLAFCLIPFGIQAVAEPGEGESTAPVNPTNEKILKFTQPTGGAIYELITKDPINLEYTLEDEDVVSMEIVNHVGYVYVTHNTGVKECYGISFVSGYFKQVSAWEFSEELSNSTTTFKEPTITDFDPATEGYYYQMGQLLETVGTDYVPIQGAEASWVNTESPGTYVTKFTNNLGFVCLKIPFGITGSTHVIAEGFVSDYSIPEKFSEKDVPLFTHVDMIKGPYCSIASNTPNAKFHIYEYVSNSSIKPRLEYMTENTYLSEIPTRMLPDGSCLMVLPDEVCDRYNLLHGSLYYSYEGDLPLGASLYEIVFEPDPNYNVDSWVLTSGVANGTVTMEVGKEYPLSIEQGPYSFKANLSEKPTPVAQTGDNTAAQTGDNNFAIIIAIIVLACACGGFVAYRKFRKK